MRTKTKGQALTEFALILPLLLLLLLGVIEGARIAWAYITVQEAAREAARYAVSGQPYSQGEPWTFGGRLLDGYQGGTCVDLNNLGGWSSACSESPAEPNAIDRVDAINRAVVQRVNSLGIKNYAFGAENYGNSAFSGTPGTLGVLVRGQVMTDTGIALYDDNAGQEGLNVTVKVYYNLEMFDPIYDAMVRAITRGNSFIQLNGEVVMQNEGVDMALGSTPPPSIPTLTPSSYGTPSGSPIVPLIFGPNSGEVNSQIRVRLEKHTASPYDIYLGDVRICANVDTGALGTTEVDCLIPPDFPPGPSQLTSRLPGGGSSGAPAWPIEITRSTTPKLWVKDGYTWPAGSPIILQLKSHTSGARYEMYFNGTSIGTTGPADAYGDVDFPWTIPSGTPPRENPNSYRFESHEIGNVAAVAHADIYVTTPQIVVQGGLTWPAGTVLRANLRRHAPNRSYEVRCNGTPIGSFTTNSNGQSISNILCTIPVVASNSPPYYTITSYDGGTLIGQVNVTVFTPADPYLVIVGGYDWPAGSPIDIEMFKHQGNHDYELYFGSWAVLSDTIRTDGSGSAQTAYIIPLTATQATTYNLRSVDPQTHATIASHMVTVRAAPQINVTEGAVVQPGSTIHISLTGHAQNAVYNILLGGVLLGSVQTDGDGQATLVYDLHNLNLAGGPFVLESRLGSTRAARTNLTIVAADLAVTRIQMPAAPVFNTSIPVTITVRNNSSVAISNQWFDTDIYVDPERVPDVAHPFPPGDFKLWLDYLGPNSSTTLVQYVVLNGTGDHRLYARTNTSANVLESDAANPVNNMMSTAVAAVGCGASVDEAKTTDATQDNAFGSGWAGVAFGDGGPGTQSIANDVIRLNSDGSSTVKNDDNGAGSGYYFYYQTVSGNFDVSVRAKSQSGSADWASFGLEVRASTAGTARKVELFQTRSYGMQYAYRAADGGPVTYDVVGGTTTNLPAWLRIARSGDDFTLYYAYTGNVPPQPNEWVPWATYNVVMSGPVLVGLANASYGSANSVTFDNLHMCIDPGSATSCGAVREQGGLAVLDAINYVQNVSRVVGGTTVAWQQVMIGGRRVMQALPDGGRTVDTGYGTGSPQLQYQVNIRTPGNYYVWVYGAGPSSSSDTVHVGLDSVENAASDRIQLNGAGSLSWSNSTMDSAPAKISGVTAGMHTLNLWMRDDGAWVYKILLTTNSNYTPSGDVDQSACAVGSGQDPYPPGMTVCTPEDAPLLSNSDFEDSPGYQTAWQPMPTMPPGTNITGLNCHDSNLCLILEGYRFGSGFLQPYTWQRFTMPAWITSTTTMRLSLWKSVDQHVTSEVTDTLKVILRTDAASPSAVSTATVLARGDQGAAWPDFLAGQWDLAPAMRAIGQDPANYTGQNLRLYIYNDSNSPSCVTFGPTCFYTSFRVDDVKLEICTSQPVPDPDPTMATIKGAVRVWINGLPIRKQGVRVWAYRQNGAMYTTYSIQDASYGFYLVDPGQYILYAEWWEGPDLYSAMTSLSVNAGIQYTRDLNLY